MKKIILPLVLLLIFVGTTSVEAASTKPAPKNFGQTVKKEVQKRNEVRKIEQNKKVEQKKQEVKKKVQTKKAEVKQKIQTKKATKQAPKK